MTERICSSEGCGRSGKLTRGMCARCYRYWLDHTPPEERGVPPRFTREFWDFVTKTHEHGCWTWTGPSDRKGYGRWGHEVASRHSWVLANGPIPDGLWVLHHCDNPPCVNPRHLYLGTVVENGRDAAVRGRAHRPRKSHCPQGHAKEGDNLLIVPSGGHLSYRCRKCENERSNRRQIEARHARGLRKTRLTEDEKARIVDLRRDGLSHRKIASVVGRSLMAVQNILREAAL